MSRKPIFHEVKIKNRFSLVLGTLQVLTSCSLCGSVWGLLVVSPGAEVTGCI